MIRNIGANKTETEKCLIFFVKDTKTIGRQAQIGKTATTIKEAGLLIEVTTTTTIMYTERQGIFA